jgi:glycosyltransferase involved in cell wall biosynthesis
MHVHNFFPLASPAVFDVAHRLNVPTVLTLHNYRLVCANALCFRDGQICELCIPKRYPTDAIKYGCYRDSKPQTLGVVLTTGFHKQVGTWTRKVNQYIALTDFARNKFIDSSLKISPEQITVKPNFIHDPGPPPAQERNGMVFIGRLSSEKGVDSMLRAFAQYQCPIKILGAGPLEDEVKAHAAQYPWIEYLGFQSKAGIIRILQQSSALVFPSAWFEGFPMVLLEAFASGCPVISTNIGSQGSIVRDGEDGLLYSPTDQDALVRCIQKLHEDPVLVQQLSRNAREIYETRYGSEANYEQLMSIYHRAEHARRR